MWSLLFKQKRWMTGFVFWIYFYLSVNFNKNKFINLIELNFYNNINLWKLTSCLNNLKLNIVVWFVLIIFWKKYSNFFEKNSTRVILLWLLLTLVLIPDVCGNLYGTTFFFKKINVALLNGIVNIHPWLTFISYSFLGWLVLIWLNADNSKKKNLTNSFFVKNFVKFLTTVFVTLSIVLGSYWSFQELSWGGWWNWDIVELTSLNFFFIIVLITHLNFFQFFKKRVSMMRIILIILITFIIVRLNLLSSIHAFISPTITKILLIKIVLLFLLIIVISKIANFCRIQANFKLKNSTMYFSKSILVITGYIVYYMIVVFITGEDNVEWSPIIIFLFLCIMVFFFNNFLLLGVGLGAIQVWPLNYIIFLTSLFKTKIKKHECSKNKFKVLHVKVVVFMLIVFFIKTYSTGFNLLKEVFLNQTFTDVSTYYFGNNFFKKLGSLNSFINVVGTNIYRDFDYGIFLLADGSATHFWKNSIYYYNNKLIKIMYLNQNVVILLYTNLFLALLTAFISFFKKKKNNLKIN